MTVGYGTQMEDEIQYRGTPCESNILLQSPRVQQSHRSQIKVRLRMLDVPRTVLDMSSRYENG
jgi:hypothetical protein